MIYINRIVTVELMISTLSVAQSLGADRFVLWFYPKLQTGGERASGAVSKGLVGARRLRNRHAPWRREAER